MSSALESSETPKIWKGLSLVESCGDPKDSWELARHLKAEEEGLQEGWALKSCWAMSLEAMEGKAEAEHGHGWSMVGGRRKA
jgi:hypothetical protein